MTTFETRLSLEKETMLKCVLKNHPKIARWLTLISVSFLLCSCGKNISTPDARAWFEKNKGSLFKINDELLNQPAIYRIDPGMHLQFVDKYAEFDQRTLKVYKNIETQCISLEIKNACVSRTGGVATGKFMSVQYTLSSVGIAPSSGGFVAVEYSTDNDYIKILQMRGQLIDQLDQNGWYLVRSSR